MAKKEGEESLHVDMPERLYEAFDVVAQVLHKKNPMFKKKHVAAAAIAAFLRMSPSEREESLYVAQDTYYRGSPTPERAQSDAAKSPRGRAAAKTVLGSGLKARTDQTRRRKAR